MLLCSSYYQNAQYRDKVQQIRFSMPSLNAAIEYLMNHSTKTIIIEILDLHEEKNGHTVCPSIEKMIALQKENPNIIYDFYALNDLEEYVNSGGKENNLSYMYHFPVSTWGMVRVLLTYKVSDIVLGEPLMFMAKEVNAYIKPYARTRVYPHKGQPSIAVPLEEMPAINHFFALPQHMGMYEEYIDVFDLLDDNIVRETALIDIYTKDSYNFSLHYLIPSITSNISGAYITEELVERRMNCKQRCIMDPNGCHYCEMIEKMYEYYKKINEQGNIDKES